MDLSRLRGIFTPLLTPLTVEERVDEASLRRLVDFVIAEGVHGLWVMGTTGEFPCLPEAEPWLLQLRPEAFHLGGSSCGPEASEAFQPDGRSATAQFISD